jgi:hypothetical protein
LIGGVGGRALPIGGGAGMMCDANGRVRGRASSPYVMALTRQGMQLNPCPVARAEMGADTTATASSAAPTPSWAIALIVVGSILIVVLIVLVLRLTQILKSL